MDTSGLKTFAQAARRSLRDQVTAKLDQVIAVQSAARREVPQAVQQLDREIVNSSRDQVIEKVAYTWFNRFSALRFMDVNEHTATRLVSPADGQTRPEILSEAMAGVLPDTLRAAAAEKIRALLDGRAPSSDPQGEAYRLLLVAACNQWHSAMPFMFEEIADYTELLMPEDLLSATSILAQMRAVMTDEACQDVEVIGWLYQFYISEKKDQVFAGLKKNVKITAENIPAATQLFTPHWIVRYLVENSLGRLWLLNRPASKLAAQMDYYIAPEEPETDFLRIIKPEDIRICDPAAGSGHMLTYAFDLLHAIYEEEGYEPTEIPALILTHNLHGVEIDDRAGALAAFALVMKAAAKLGRRRFLHLGVQPNICMMQDVRFTQAEMEDVAAVVGRDLFTAALRDTLGQFEQAKNFGSLIVPKLHEPAEVARVVRLKDFGGDLLLRDVQERVLKVLEMAEALSPKYHVVVANPPYMGAAGMNIGLKVYAAEKFQSSKGDLFSMFIERSFHMVRKKAFISMITLQNWMFLSTYRPIREKILKIAPIRSLVQIGFNSFPELNSKFALGAGFVLQYAGKPLQGDFINLNDAPHSANKRSVFIEKKKSGDIYRVNPTQFSSIIGSPIQFTFSKDVFRAFSLNKKMGDVIDARNGMTTGDNNCFVRGWSEVSFANTSIKYSLHQEGDNIKWFPYNKGGQTRKWYGNQEFIVDWQAGGREINAIKPKSTPRNTELFFKPSISWSDINIKNPSFRYYNEQFCFDAAVNSAFPLSRDDAMRILSACNNRFVAWMAPILNPSMHFKIGDFSALPASLRNDEQVLKDMEWLVAIAKSDWDAYETSWEFSALPLLESAHRQASLAATYAQLRAHWQGMTSEMQRLEEENNRIFIQAYGLEGELTPEVPLEEITLTSNPAYRYGGKKTAEELEAALLSDTMREFLSYAVGCMFGRYSLDAPGLILANQGDGLAEYLAKVPDPSFAPDADNVIPMLDEDWFPDDVTERFRRFLRMTFGDEHFQDNLGFIEKSLGKDIRKYFTKDFFNDHVKRYKKRPIYWLFSSPKGTFNALIYMHRYTADTVGVLLNDYVREFRSKLETRKAEMERQSIRADASPGQQTAALKELQKIALQIDELDRWERDVVYPMASQRIEIDLDDGVKANYPKFEGALKPIKGLSDVED